MVTLLDANIGAPKVRDSMYLYCLRSSFKVYYMCIFSNTRMVNFSNLYLEYQATVLLTKYLKVLLFISSWSFNMNSIQISTVYDARI